MSYIVDIQTRESFLDGLTEKERSKYDTVLNQFNYFTTDVYQKKGDTVLTDLMQFVKQEKSNDRIYALLNQFTQWLLVDHPEIEYFLGKNKTQSRTIKTRHPNTVRLYLIKIRSIFEEIGNIEINSRSFNKRIKILRPGEKDLDSLMEIEKRLGWRINFTILNWIMQTF